MGNICRMGMENFSLNLTEFEDNIKDGIRKLRDQRRNNVTLATDDGEQMQAHKIILTGGSNFLGAILIKAKYSNMLIYLKQSNKAELKHILDFMENREAVAHQEEIKVYIESGKELKVKNLVSRLKEIDENDELEHRIKNKIEKIENGWKCKNCEKTMTRQRDMRIHVETHMVGMSRPCHQCGKTFSTRGSLRVHISSIHSELLSCDVCGKSEMNKQNYWKHKNRHHRKLSMISPNTELSMKPLVPEDDLESKSDIQKEEISQNNVLDEAEQKNVEIDTSDMGDVIMDVHIPDMKPSLPGKRPYMCKQCDASFKGHSGLIYHTRRKHEGILYSC